MAGSAHDVLLAPAEHVLRAGVPAGDAPVQSQGEDGVVARALDHETVAGFARRQRRPAREELDGDVAQIRVARLGTGELGRHRGRLAVRFAGPGMRGRDRGAVPIRAQAGLLEEAAQPRHFGLELRLTLARAQPMAHSLMIHRNVLNTQGDGDERGSASNLPLSS